MSVPGQSRHFGCVLATSGLPGTTEIIRPTRHVSNVPWTQICAGAELLRTWPHTQKRKAACVAASGPSLGRKRPRRAAMAGWGGRYRITLS